MRLYAMDHIPVIDLRSHEQPTFLSLDMFLVVYELYIGASRDTMES